MGTKINNTHTIRVGIIDDHVIFTRAIADLLNNIPGFHVVLQAVNGDDLLKQLNTLPELPDVLLMDIDMEVMNGIEATRRVTDLYPAVKIVALTMMKTEINVIKMIRAGCCAYLKKDVSPAELEKALHEVYFKGKYHADIYSRYATRLLAYEKEMQVQFTENEIRFLQLTCKGLTQREIATIMNLSEATIDAYRSRLFEKLKVNNRITMVLEALRRELISLGAIDEKI